MIPLQSPGPERFHWLRSFLRDAGFTEPDLCARLKIRNLGELKPAGAEREPERLESACSVLIHLFLDREPADAKTVQARLGTEAAGLLAEFGLLRAHPSNQDACLSTVMLYPLYGLYIASDRDWEPETGRGNLPHPDAVYLAITPNAYDYLAALPISPCDEFLDLCSGAGISAMIAARDYAKSATACDILERCTGFAAWSARLNGVTNLEGITGNLYDPLPGRSFDRIVAHPPYVPSEARVHIFRDGGTDGEQVTRGIIEGLPAALRPGGQCHITAAFADRRDAPVETRLRAMLGAHESEFDVFVAVRRSITVQDFFQAEAAAERAREGGIDSFAYCSVGLQRRATQRPVFTIRRNLTTVAGPMVEWVLRWEAMHREPGFGARLLRERLTTAEDVRLNVVHELKAKKWVPSGATIAAVRPFPVEEGCPPWVSALLELCDGRAAVRDALETLKARGVIPPQASGVEFARMVQILISSGFLEIGSHRLPQGQAGLWHHGSYDSSAAAAENQSHPVQQLS